jgi:hypothetical protein
MLTWLYLTALLGCAGAGWRLAVRRKRLRDEREIEEEIRQMQALRSRATLQREFEQQARRRGTR